MPIPPSGPLSLLDIQTEFGGSNPIGLNEYYAGGGLVAAGTSGTNGPVPSSGAISIFNFYGTSAVPPFAAVEYTVAGTYSFVVPTGITSISAVCVGASGGALTGVGRTGSGGGGLSYTNSIPVTPGESLTVTVGTGGAVSGAAGGPSSIARGASVLLSAQGSFSAGPGGQASSGVGAVRYSGGSAAGLIGGGGAAGYSGNGGNAAVSGGNGSPGAGGGGGGGANTGAPRRFCGGGGVGLIVEGASGAGGVGGGGWGGSGGTPGGINSGGAVGGGTAMDNDSSTVPGQFRAGVPGGVRIIYGGTGKSYPNNSAP